MITVVYSHVINSFEFDTNPGIYAKCYAYPNATLLLNRIQIRSYV